MKWTSLVLLMMLFIFSYAQKPLMVASTNEGMSQGSNKGLKVLIPAADAKDVERLWRKEMKSYKGKVGSSKGEIFCDNAVMTQISDNTIDVYAKIKKVNEGTLLTVFFDLGGAYLNAGDNGYKSAEKIVYEFAVSAAKDAVDKEIKEEQKALAKLENAQEKLEREKETLDKNIKRWNDEIEKAKKDIENAKADIEQNIKDQEKSKADIAEQMTTIDGITKKRDDIK